MGARAGRHAGLLALLLVVAAPHVGPAAPPAVPQPLSQLAWMAGHWIRHGADGSSSEEIWLAPRARLMPGLNREVTRTGRSQFEFLRIEQREDGRIVYVASPGGGPPTEFALSQIEGQRATFENPTHDFPRTLSYWREGDTLHARAEGQERGVPRQLTYRWQLQRNP
jgi:hypothetical protein